MPSKEEIEQAKRNCKRVLETDPLKSTIDFQYNDVDTLIEGLEQLEAERKSVINYLKEEIDTMGSGKGMFLVKTALGAVLEKTNKEK